MLSAYELPTIERGVQPPKERHPSRRNFLSRLEVDESFSFSQEDRKGWQSAAAKFYDRKFTIKRLESGDCRLWRIR